MKVIGLILLLFVSSFLYAKQTPHDVFLLAATPCYDGQCPAYDAMLFSDGTLIFIGKRDVEYEGLYKFSIGEKIFKQVVKLTKEYEFQSFRDSYGVGDQSACKQFWSDNSTTVMSLRLSGNNKTVKHYHGCQGFEREKALSEFEAKIKELLNIKRYVKGEEKSKEKPKLKK